MSHMLQTLKVDAQPQAALIPFEIADLPEIAGASTSVIWVDASDPTNEELRALVAAFGWPEHVLDVLEDGEARQRFLQMDEWSVISTVSPVGDGTGMIAISGTRAITLRRNWGVDLADTARDVVHWPDGSAGGIVVACVLLGHLVEAYEDASGDLEERLVSQEATALNESSARDLLPTLRETAHLRGSVGDLRRRSNRLREVLGAVIRQELVDRTHGDAVDLDLRDIYDHLLRVHDDLDAYSDRLTAVQDTRLSLVAYKQNDIVRKISGWGAVLLIPTITTGWFGQNFVNLPLRDNPYGEYFSLGITLGAMALAVAALRHAKWL